MSVRTREQRQHILDVADAIETHESQFDMAAVFDETHCGTTACIAGWSDALTWNLDMSEPLTFVDRNREYGPDGQRLQFDERFAVRSGLSIYSSAHLCGEGGIGAWISMPAHLRAKGMADALRQIADGKPVEHALDDVTERYGVTS